MTCLARVTQRVTGGGVLQPHHGHDLASDRGRALLALVRVHLVDLADPLLAALGRVEHLGAGLELAGVDADVGQLAEVLVGHDLEGQRGERLGRVRVPLDDDLLVADRMALDRRDVDRARQEVDDRVQHRLHALVLERAAAQHRRHAAGDGGAPDRGDQLVGIGLGAFQVELHHLFVVLGDGLYQLVPPLTGRLGVVIGDRDDVVGVALALGLPEQPAHADQVDHAAEVGLDAPRQLNHQRGRAEPVGDHFHAAVELSADPVHLVDEADPRHAVAVRLPPDRLGLRLDAGHAVEDRDSAVENAQRALHLDGEVDVARRVDQVDGVVTPHAGRRRGGNRDAALLLLLHPVHRGCALVDLTDLVVDAGVEQDPLGGRGFARVDMRHDADVPDVGEFASGLCRGHCL